MWQIQNLNSRTSKCTNNTLPFSYSCHFEETNNANISVLIDDDDHIELWRPVFNIQNLVSTVSYNLGGRTSSQVYAVRVLKENVTLVSSVTNIYATTHCGLFLEKFPFDQQSCSFKVLIE